jgi:hypothetical protein
MLSYRMVFLAIIIYWRETKVFASHLLTNILQREEGLTILPNIPSASTPFPTESPHPSTERPFLTSYPILTPPYLTNYLSIEDCPPTLPEYNDVCSIDGICLYNHTYDCKVLILSPYFSYPMSIKCICYEGKFSCYDSTYLFHNEICPCPSELPNEGDECYFSGCEYKLWTMLECELRLRF